MVDPITLEIVNNRLQQIGLQAGYALLNTAASTVVVHAKDLGFNISDHLGQCVVYSMWMPRHGTNLSYMLRACKAAFQERIYPGDPLDRDPLLVLKDFMAGYVSLEKAEADYGVVIDAKGRTVDAKATADLRERIRKVVGESGASSPKIPDSQAAVLIDKLLDK